MTASGESGRSSRTLRDALEVELRVRLRIEIGQVRLHVIQLAEVVGRECAEQIVRSEYGLPLA